MKRIIALILCAVMILSLAACGAKKDNADKNGEDKVEVKVGFIFLHDENSTYDNNFIKAAKEACDKLGVEYEIFRPTVCKYKSAVEPYFLKKMSPENREQNEQMIGSMWQVLNEAVAESRGISVEELNRLADECASLYPDRGVKLITYSYQYTHGVPGNGYTVPDNVIIDFCFEYRKEPPAEYDLRLLYTKIEKALIMGAENPDINVGEILKEIALTDAERNGKPECKSSHSLLKSLKTTLKLTKSRLKTILSLISA